MAEEEADTAVKGDEASSPPASTADEAEKPSPVVEVEETETATETAATDSDDKALSDAGSAFEESADVILDDKEMSTASLILEETDYVDTADNEETAPATADATAAMDEEEAASTVSYEEATAATTTVVSTSSTGTSMPLSPAVSTSTVFLDKALKAIAASREAKRSKELAEAAQKAIDLLEMEDAAQQMIANFYTIFTPLQLACQSGSIPLTIAAIDCIEKLVSYKLIGSDAHDRAVATEEASADEAKPSDTEQQPATAAAEAAVAEAAAEEGEAAPTATTTRTSIIDDIITVICDAFIGENTDDKVTLQIIKALLAAVSQSERPVHQSALLRAVRTTYNIFLLSGNSANQTIAQGTLTQMVNIIFTRVRLDPKLRSSVEEGTLGTTSSTGQDHATQTSKPTNDTMASSLSSTDVEIRDAYLVFRALCKLSMKPVPNDSATDLRSLSMRSKLLALHLVLDVLAAHQLVFLAPVAVVTTNADGSTTATTTTTTFISTVKQHLCLTLSRNLVSVIPAVFECALELFWQVLCNFRMFLKKEIEVFFTEIFLPILEMKNSP
ncbi:guanine nucleotide exchange factor in Golgi transport N-terminal-domain-containing protein, partial [Syncephalis pseudoplumigaleata]